MSNVLLDFKRWPTSSISTEDSVAISSAALEPEPSPIYDLASVSTSSESSSQYDSNESIIGEDSRLDPSTSPRLLFVPEYKVWSISFIDFCEHGLGVSSEKVAKILSTDWTLDSAALADCRSSLQAENHGTHRLAIERLISTTAKRTSGLFGEYVDLARLSHNLEFMYTLSTAPGHIFFVGSPRLPGFDEGTINMAEIYIGECATKALSAPGIHHIIYVLVARTSVSIWYFDRAYVFRTTWVDFLHDPQLFALFVCGMSCCTTSFQVPQIQEVPSWALFPGWKMWSYWLALPPTSPRTMPYSLFYCTGLLFQSTGSLLCRGTIVCEVVLDSSDPINNANGVLKLSWREALPVRLYEAQIIQKIVEAIPSWDTHLPRIRYWATYSAADLKLPRVAILNAQHLRALEEDKNLHAFVTFKYQHLWEVENIQEFQDAFADCLECHYQVYTNARVLHRDISWTNLMFQRYTQRIFTVAGVLNDWDVASEVNEDDELSAPDRSRRIGSVAFAARGLLERIIHPHQYHHDLESFLYVLVWCAVHCDLKQKMKRSTEPILEDWTKTRAASREAKVAFIYDDEVADGVFDKVGEDFRGVLDAWIKPWRNFLREAGDEGATFNAVMKILGRESHELGKY